MSVAPRATDKKNEMLSLPRENIVNPEEIESTKSAQPQSAAIESKGNAKQEPTESEALTLVESFEDDVILKEIGIKEKVEDARGRLAIIFTVATFTLFFLGFLLAAFTEGNKVENLKEIFLTISGIFSGLLGFVIGYYFRKEEEK